MTEPTDSDRTSKTDEPRIVVVGPCASGKSTLAARLRVAGFDARVCGQEHSEIQSLWRRMNPDMVVGLHIDLETLRERRGSSWSERIFNDQQRRLRDAYQAADIHIDSVRFDEETALAMVLDVLRTRTGDF